MTDAHVRTAWIIFGYILLGVTIDLWLIGHYGEESSFSRTLRAAGEQWGALPYIACFICGAWVAHCWW